MGESIVKRLIIKATTNYDLSDSQIVPVNTNTPIEIESDIGIFSLIVNIKNFDGSSHHSSNSLYNINDKNYLNGDAFEPSSKNSTTTNDLNPNLRFQINFKPKSPIKGSELLYGNDFMVPIRDYIPTTLLSTGLKFFTWFINKTIKGDIYNDKPYLYGLALNSFSFMAIRDSKFLNKKEDHTGEVIDDANSTSNKKKDSKIVDALNFVENLNDNTDNILKIPSKSIDRKKFFTNTSNCEDFVFNESTDYTLQFDTNYLKLADSKYAVSIPTFGNKTFDIDVSSYANDKLDNFNWVIKQGGYDGVGSGKVGLIVNFALANETDSN